MQFEKNEIGDVLPMWWIVLVALIIVIGVLFFCKKIDLHSIWTKIIITSLLFSIVCFFTGAILNLDVFYLLAKFSIVFAVAVVFVRIVRYLFQK